MRELINSLIRLVGNKRYMTTVQKMLERVDMNPEEKQAIRYLINDLNSTKNELDRAKRKAKQPWMP